MKRNTANRINRIIMRMRGETQARLTQIFQMQEYIEEYLRLHPCVDCGEADPRVLDFDHVHGEKSFAISQFAERYVSWNELYAEIGKCQVRCRHCHNRRHWPTKHRYLTREYAETTVMRELAQRFHWPFDEVWRRRLTEYLDLKDFRPPAANS